MRSTLRTGLAAALAVSSLVFAPGAKAAPVGERVGSLIIKVAQAPPTIVNVAHPEGGPGGASYYEADLTRDGKPFGRLLWTILQSDVTPDSSGLEVRMRTLVFDLPEGQVVAIGASEYKLPLVGNVPALRAAAKIAIVGGTGKYSAARGEVTTVRNPEGTYDHVLSVVK
ncbi:MAG: hypothetical protein ACKPBU_10145 [Alphaproteobacteria bacterium]